MNEVRFTIKYSPSCHKSMDNHTILNRDICRIWRRSSLHYEYRTVVMKIIRDFYHINCALYQRNKKKWDGVRLPL